MILVSMWVLYACTVTASAATAAGSPAAELDGLLHEYAFEALLLRRPPKTGVAYDGAVSRNLTGIRVSAMRLKSGSLMRRGVSAYQEFRIPKGVVTHPYVERLALLYHNLANWSAAYYPLHGYTYLAPVVGLLAYDASRLEAGNLTFRLDIHASGQPISIHFPRLWATAAVPKCVFFDVNGSVSLGDVAAGGVCTTFRQGHFSVVVESAARGAGAGSGSKVWKIVFGVLAAVVVVVAVAVVGARRRRKERKRMVAELSEGLYMTAVGTPAAVPTRTHPKIETDYVP